MEQGGKEEGWWGDPPAPGPGGREGGRGMGRSGESDSVKGVVGGGDREEMERESEQEEEKEGEMGFQLPSRMFKAP